MLDGTGLGYSSRSTLLRDQLAITLSDGSKRSRMEGLSGFKRDLVRSWRKGTSDDVVHHLMYGGSTYDKGERRGEQ